MEGTQTGDCKSHKFSPNPFSLIHGKASNCAQQFSQLQAPSETVSASSGAITQDGGRENSWSSSKILEERNYFQNVCCLIVKNHDSVFPLLNNTGGK